jgi:hypothetical protein
MTAESGEERRQRTAILVLLPAEAASVVHAVIELINWHRLTGLTRDNVARCPGLLSRRAFEGRPLLLGFEGLSGTR